MASRTIRAHFKEHVPRNKDIYSSEAVYLPEHLEDYFEFIFVRNPLGRFVRACRNRVLQQNYFGFSEEEFPKMQEVAYLLDWLEGQGPDTCERHFRAQSRLNDPNEVNFLGRFENFSIDLSTLCRKAGVPVKDLPVRNQMDAQKLELDNDSRERVARCYEGGFILFHLDFLRAEQGLLLADSKAQ